MRRRHLFALLLAASFATPLLAQIHIVDILPASMSDEQSTNAEPSVTVDPTNPQRVVATAFIAATPGSTLAPVFLSMDAGNNWAPANIVPTCNGCSISGDTTLRFATAANPNQANLYAAILSNTGPTSFVALRTFDQALASAMTSIEGRNNSIDQPYIQSRGVVGWYDPGKERIYIGINEYALRPKSATIDDSLDAAATGPGLPAFTTTHVDAGAPFNYDNYQIRPAIAADGRIYAAFIRRLSDVMNVGYTADIVVVRDDNWAKGANPFTNLVDSGLAIAGQRVTAMPITITDDCCCYDGSPACITPNKVFPGQRMGGDLAIVTDPNDSGTVYVSYADRQAADPMTLHLMRSTDSGQTWPTELLTIPGAKNASIAVNSQGAVAYLYQQWSGTTPNHRWQTHLRRQQMGGWTDDVLNDEPCEWISPNVTNCVWTGDYDYVTAAGKNFYGVFSALNTPANFPAGTVYLRNHDGATPPNLLKSDNMTAAVASVDPFFFRSTELAAGDDFYVRDWTDSMTVYDHGLEPSSHPDFFDFSDVWNERTNDPLAPDAQNRPQSNDPQPMMLGPNYAFVRVSREAGGGAADVAVDFFYSDGGVGVPYQSAGSGSVHFAAGQTQVSPAAGDGVSWNLPSGASNHVCLAAQIHTASDPFIAPTLDLHAPGWPSGTDLAVLGDNNKAQRNMQVFGGMSGGMSMWALVHNAARRVRDMTIGVDFDPEIEKIVAEGSVSFAAGREMKSLPLRQHSTLVLESMQPGEDRWVMLHGTLRDIPEKPATVRIYELNGNAILNGYGFIIRHGDAKEVAGRNIFQHAAVFARSAELFGDAKMADEAKRARAYPYDRYDDLLKSSAPLLKALVSDLVTRNGGTDPIGMKKAFEELNNATGTDRASAHLSLLNAIDATETMIQRSKRQ